MKSAALLLMFACPITAQAQVTLAWKFEAGDLFALEETVQARQAIKVNSAETRQDLDQVRRSRISVLKKNPDGSLVLEQKIEKIKVQHGGEGPDANTKVLKQLEGASFWFHLDAKNKIGPVEGYDTLVKQLAKDNRADAKLIRAVLTEESFKRGLDAWLGFLPAEPVEINKSWKRKSSLPLGLLGAMALDTSYKLADFNKKTQVATIALSGIGTYQPPRDDNDLPLKIGGGSLRLSKYSGKITFNADKGRLIRLETNMSLQGKLMVINRDSNMDMELSQEQTLIIKSSPGKP